MAEDMKFTLVRKEHGLKDIDVKGLPGVHRICISHRIREGDIFNVYCSEGRKLGATWEGTIQKSMEHFAATHRLYRELVA